MIVRQSRAWRCSLTFVLILLLGFTTPAIASIGDRLPEFRTCVATCTKENCGRGNIIVPVHLRLLFWTCPSNCDHVCQHIITDQRLARDPPMLSPVVQYHGKWPFHRILGVQEPCSVVFSLFNLLAHRRGLSQIKERIPAEYPLRKYYMLFGYIGILSWVFSMAFHTRDFDITEKLDYFAAGASVLYGLYFTSIRIFRLDQRKHPVKATLLRLWTLICILMYVAHVSYLTLWRWDYTYNMAANVAVGVMQNIMWSSFSVKRYQKLKKPWAAWPGMIVAWIVLAMSLELLDFPPAKGLLDAHSLWHLGTVGPTIWWYNFLIKDAQQEIAGERLKA
ncbi:MAG: hypothetical protein Q9172_003637 [Xanthocarpia lactea]